MSLDSHSLRGSRPTFTAYQSMMTFVYTTRRWKKGVPNRLKDTLNLTEQGPTSNIFKDHNLLLRKKTFLITSNWDVPDLKSQPMLPWKTDPCSNNAVFLLLSTDLRTENLRRAEHDAQVLQTASRVLHVQSC